MTLINDQIQIYWANIAPLLTIRNEREYNREEEHYPIPASTGADVLRYLMEEHGLSQTDLPEVGSQGVVSEILSGKRELNVRQIRVLAGRFGVSPAVFI
jgi:HTH-type transcriptional regulator/antitoxin HigA